VVHRLLPLHSIIDTAAAAAAAAALLCDGVGMIYSALHRAMSQPEDAETAENRTTSTNSSELHCTADMQVVLTSAVCKT
jgi:hypothetical protein